jgi:polyferredoxin
MGYPKGLVRYATLNSLKGKPARVLRPRTLIYGALLLSLGGGLLYSLSQRVPLGLDVIRDRNQLFRETKDGRIENVYTLKLINMDERPHRYTLQAEGLPSLELVGKTKTIAVQAGSVVDLPVRLRAEESDLKSRSSEVRFTLTAVDDARLSVTEDTRFLGPTPHR